MPPHVHGDTGIYPSPILSEPAAALLRLRGALDAAMREALPPPQLIALADRINAGGATAADRGFLAAFCATDLAAANMRAAEFVVVQAVPYRAVVAVMGRPVASMEAIPLATTIIGTVTMILGERLNVLPDAEELERVGALFLAGQMTQADLAVVRALPGPYLRAVASAKHYATFVDYRLDD